MTTEYLNREPLFPSWDLPPDFLVDKWTHSITFESNFLTEWGAVEKARNLAFDLGTYNGIFGHPRDCGAPCVASSQPQRRVRFSGDVDVRIGNADDFIFHQLTVPERALFELRKWREVSDLVHDLGQHAFQTVDDPHLHIHACISSEKLPPSNFNHLISQMRINDAWHHPLPPDLQDQQDANQEEDPDVIPDPVHAPAFVHDLLNLAERHRTFTDLDTEDAFHIRTWYLHHVNLPRGTIPRFLEFHEDWRRWERDIMLSWREFLVPHEAVQLHVAAPDPYRGYLNRPVHADLLISQGIWAHRLPGLITVHYQGRQLPPLNYAVAISFEYRISGVDIVAAADALQWCTDPSHRCRILHGWQEIPFTREPTHRMAAGHSFVIHIWSQLQPLQVMHSPAHDGSATVDYEPTADRPADDTNTPRSRTPVEGDSEKDGGEEGGEADPPPDAQSDSSIHSGDLGVLVYRLNAPDGHCFVPWQHRMTILDGILHALRLPRREFRCYHVLAVTPVDVQRDSEEVVILQSISDIPAGSNDKLILIDTVIHFHPHANGLLVPAASSRKVARVQPHLHRQQLLLLQGLEDYCHINGDRCTVYKNDRIWSSQDRRVHDMQHGDYVRIQVPPPEDPTLDTEVAIHVAREFALDASTLCSSGATSLALFQQSTEIFRQVDDALRSPSLSIDSWKTDPTTEGAALPPRADGPPRTSMRTTTGNAFNFADRQLEQLLRIVERADLVECEEEGNIAYITTWFIHHAFHKECRQSRSVRLTMPSHDWPNLIVEEWNDLILPGESVTLRLIQPQPPCTDLECNQAHVIVEQGQHADHVAFLISTQSGDTQRFGRSMVSHSAHSDTPLQNALSIIRLARPQNIPQGGDCSVYWRDFPFAFVDFEEITAGAGLVLRIRGPVNYLDMDLHSLMQRPHSHAGQVSGNEGTSAPGLNPHAACFHPAGANIFDQDEFIQTLQPIWDANAFSWQSEEPSGCIAVCIAVWFVDHQWQYPHGPQFRTLRLWTDFTDWRRQIELAWQDQRVAGSELEMQVVDPKPATTDHSIFAHVIVIQRPNPSWVTSIVTAFDISQAVIDVRQMAITTHEHILLDNLLHVIGLYNECATSPIRRFCQAWWRQQQLQLGRPLMGRTGYAIDIQHRTTASYFGHRFEPPPEGIDAMNLLQTQSSRIKRRTEGRQTSELVAHTHWPSEPSENIADSLQSHSDFPTVGQRVPADWNVSEQTVIVRVLHAQDVDFWPHLPQYIELNATFSAADAADELARWGHHCQAFLCGAHDTVFISPVQEIPPTAFTYVYCGLEETLPEAVTVNVAPHKLTEGEHMRFLHGQGFTKAVIKATVDWQPQLSCLHFEDVQPQHELQQKEARQRTPWPTRQPLPQPQKCLIKSHRFEEDDATCLLRFDWQEVDNFIQSGRDILWQDHTILDLPDFIRQALDECTQVDRIDRYVIYTDGSSHSRHKHQPPEWIAENDVSDSWAFLVLAEQYDDQADRPSKVQFLGLQCHQVLYEKDAPHHIGTQHVGSDAAETEALFWAGLWRASQNNAIPTVFLTDSRLIGDQATGRIGSLHAAAPFRNLRAIFQTLAALLPGDRLRVAHVRGHTGDPFNEMVDWLAKHEALSSLFLPRQKINMQTLGTLLHHLWMAVEGQCDLPRPTSRGFDLGRVALPPESSSTTEARLAHAPPFQEMTVSMSFATANVRTFYRGEEGFPGKLAYVREQFRQHRINFMGLQETRTEMGSSFQQDVYRLAGGCSKGQLGIELWVNLGQPFAWCGKRPVQFEKQHFVVTSASPRHLLVHVQNANIDFWLLTAHAPHSGDTITNRADWWHSLTATIQESVPQGKLVMMVDANSTTGAADGRHIFANDDAESANTPFFREFLEIHDLYVPSSTKVHHGEFSTWIHPVGDSQHRIDYVLLPCTWRDCCTYSENLQALDFGHLGDHQATAAAVQWTDWLASPSRPERQLSHCRADIQFDRIHEALEAYQPPPWGTNIETQVDELNAHILHSLHETCPPRVQGPKKSFITDDIWQCRAQKLRLQRRHGEQTRVARTDLLTRIFRCWKTGCTHADGSLDAPFLISLRIKMLHTGIATRQAARTLRKKLSQAKAKAVEQAVATLPHDCAASKILHSLKPIIGTTNPKLRKTSPLPAVLDEHGAPCTTPAALIDRWVSFFGAMEGGERMQYEDLRKEWRHELRHFMQESLDLGPADLPTLTDLERAFRRVRPHKAVGEDKIPPELCHSCPVEMARLTYGQLLKLCTHGQEALLHKGGVLVAAWKRKGSQQLCESYRSLLISSHIAKTVHRAVRDHQASVYEAFLQREQIGGRKSIPVSMGVHYIRAAARTAKRLGQSHALIFLDLREAFYRVLRPLSIGGIMPDALLAQVAARLHLPDDALADLRALLRLPAGTEMAAMPRHMQRALRPAHQHSLPYVWSDRQGPHTDRQPTWRPFC